MVELIKKEGMTLARREDGYVNATALCKSGGKLFNDYSRLGSTQEFLAELAPVTGIPVTDLVQVRNGGIPTEQGTYVHPKVAIHLGQWISPKYAVFVSEVLFDLHFGRAKKVDPRFAHIVSPKRLRPSIFPAELTAKLRAFYGIGCSMAYNRIYVNALGEEAAAELKRIAGTSRSRPRWEYLTEEGKSKVSQYTGWLAAQPADTPLQMEALLFGRASIFGKPFEFPKLSQGVNNG